MRTPLLPSAVAARRSRLWGLAVVGVLACPGSAAAADVLNEAQVRIAVETPLTCSVTATLTVTLDAARDLEQRLQRVEGSRIEAVEIAGVETAAPPRRFGVTEVFTLRFASAGLHRYEVRYRATQPEGWAWRCPVWLPVIATDGRSRQIGIEVTLPPGARPAGASFPAFRWEERLGSATLGSLPAFVRTPYASPDEARSPGLDYGRAMDYVAAGVLLVGTAIWVIRRRR